MRKKVQTKIEEQLSNVELHTESETRENDLLKQLVNQNEQVIQLLTKLKERFI